MGQEMSRRHSDDSVSIFPPIGNSSTSIASDSRLDDVTYSQCPNKREVKICHRLSQLKESISNCFRSNFAHLHEIDENDEILSVQRPISGCFDNGGMVNTNGLPQDIRELHNQLSLLKRLLSLPELNGAEVTMREMSCQTIDNGSNFDHLLRQRDSVISDQLSNLSRLHHELDNKNQTIHRYIRELSALKALQSRQSIENKNFNQLLTLLRDLRTRKRIELSDLEKIEEIILQMSHLSGSMKSHVDNSNVAIVSPCTNRNVDIYNYTSSSIVLPSDTDFQNSILPPNPVSNPFRDRKDSTDIKLICFLDHSVSPYISSIPISSTGITLSHIKHYTHSILPNNAKGRYFFRSLTASSGQTQEELYCDTDMVPVQDNKIVVRIRM